MTDEATLSGRQRTDPPLRGRSGKAAGGVERLGRAAWPARRRSPAQPPSRPIPAIFGAKGGSFTVRTGGDEPRPLSGLGRRAYPGQPGAGPGPRYAAGELRSARASPRTLFSSRSACPTCSAPSSPRARFRPLSIPMFNKKGRRRRRARGGGSNSPSGRWRCAAGAAAVHDCDDRRRLAGDPGAFRADFNHPTPEQFAFAVGLSRITIPYLALISLASLLGGILNSLNRFWVNAAAPILLNVAMIAALWFFHGADRLRDRAGAGDFGHRRRRAPARLADLRLPPGRREAQAPAPPARRRYPPADEADPPRPRSEPARSRSISPSRPRSPAPRLLDSGSISYIYYARPPQSAPARPDRHRPRHHSPPHRRAPAFDRARTPKRWTPRIAASSSRSS